MGHNIKDAEEEKEVQEEHDFFRHFRHLIKITLT